MVGTTIPLANETTEALRLHAQATAPPQEVYGRGSSLMPQSTSPIRNRKAPGPLTAEITTCQGIPCFASKSRLKSPYACILGLGDLLCFSEAPVSDPWRNRRRLQGPPRPHKHKDATFWLSGPRELEFKKPWFW